jgi:hypothetical protein
VYRANEHSFDFIPAAGSPRRGGRSVLVNDLQLEIDEAGCVLYAWGLAPQTEWQAASLTMPAATPGALWAMPSRKIVAGASVRVDWARWPTLHDADNGVVCIGDAATSGTAAVRFAQGCVAVLEGNQLAAVWLRADRTDDEATRAGPALRLEPFGDGYLISEPAGLSVTDRAVWATIRSELAVRTFADRPVTIAERRYSRTPSLAGELAKAPSILLGGGGFWATPLPRADRAVLRDLATDSSNFGGDLWMLGTNDREVADAALRAALESLPLDATPSSSPCEAMSTVWDDHAVCWLHPTGAPQDVRGAVVELASSVGWRVIDGRDNR